MFAVVLGHFYFAYKQWFKWPELCADLTELEGGEVAKTAFLGRSFASYNASVGLGLNLSFRLSTEAIFSVQAIVLAMIVATAAVGSSGVRGNKILVGRLAPAAFALVFLFLK